MKFTFQTNRKTESRELENGFHSVLLSDGYGSYFSQGLFENSTRYHGFFCKFPEGDEWTLFKVIERIEIPDVKEIIKTERSIEYSTENNSIVLSMKRQQLCISAEKDVELKIILDPRKIYDFSTEGRDITVGHDDGITIS